jgi:hypothetical protein
MTVHAYKSAGWVVLRYSVIAIAVFFIVVRFLPALPAFVGSSQDEGWSWGINVAAAQHAQFGRDVVFTYGPYGAVISRTYHQLVYGRMLLGGALLGAAFAGGLAALGNVFVLAAVAMLLPIVSATDALAFALPLPALLLCAVPRGEVVPRRAVVAVLLLLPALALLPLTKFSLVPVSGVSLLVLVVLLWRGHRSRLALAAPLLTAILFLLLWVSAGQAIGGLPAFFAGELQLALGADAMSWPGPLYIVIELAGACFVFLALLAWGARRAAWQGSSILVAGMALLLYVAFKAGLVRADGHEIITVWALALMFLVLAAWLRGAGAFAATAAAALLLCGPAAPHGLQPELAALGYGPGVEWQGALRLLTGPGVFNDILAASEARVPPLPWQPAGTADMYGSALSRLLVSGLAWSPRPVLESYSAYTPALARLDADHLTGAAAPDNVFFRPDPIDYRLPALEDGLSWPALLSLYMPAGYDMSSGLAWLKHAAPPL